MLKFLIIIGLLVLALQNCKRNPNGGKTVEVNINLSVEETGVTESWLKIEIDHPAAVKSVSLLRNDSTVTQFSAQKDTLLMDENLEPNRTYVYQVSLLLSGGEKQKSAKAETVTMDTTSHNFTWETFEFGGNSGRPSFLYDVAIINENNIWAVGKIHTAETDQWNEDSTEWIKPYNAAHWDGDKWELKRIMFYTFCNQTDTSAYPARAVYNFGDKIIISSGSQVTYIENEIQTNIECVPVSINAIWGTSSSDFYVVGYGGNIAHYNGTSWSKMVSGTDINLLDIDGTPDGKHLFTYGYDSQFPSRSIISEYDGQNWNTIYYFEGQYFPGSEGYGHLDGIGILGDKVYITTEDSGLWKYNYITKKSQLVPNSKCPLNESAFKDVLINSRNDIFFPGAGFAYIHYNGYSYHYNPEIKNMFSRRGQRGADYKGNIAVMVGDLDVGYYAVDALLVKGIKQ
jgi:hypothetical protein